MHRKILFTLIFLFSTFTFPVDNSLRDKIAGILSKVPSSTACGVLVYNPMTKDTIFQLNKFKPLIPASNTKLFTTGIAISELGGDFLLSVKIFTDDNDVNDGIINGNLYIKGFGNALFTSEDLSRMIAEIKKLGIRRITGEVIGDDTYFDAAYSRDDWIDEEVQTVRLPPVSALVLNRNSAITQVTKKKKTVTVSSRISNPPLQIAEIVKNRLNSEGITVSGGANKGITPANAKLLASSSVTLRNYIAAVNKHSDNYLAECLFKTLGAEVSGYQGNAFYATQAELTFLTENSIYSKGTSLVDGSGLSRYDQVTTAAIAGLLETLYFDSKNFDDFYKSLSIAGRDGTLRNRMGNTKADNNMHGKTGTLNGVSSVSGYVKNLKGEDIIVSIIFDYTKGGNWQYHEVQDAIIELVANSH